MFGIYVYWCSLVLLLDLQTWNKRKNLVCVAYCVVVFEHLNISLKLIQLKLRLRDYKWDSYTSDKTSESTRIYHEKCFMPHIIFC